MDSFRECDAAELLAQIGIGNIWAISGGRVLVRESGVSLQVGNGYWVTVDLDANDLYVVRRVYVRGMGKFVKGELRDVDAFQLGDVAYKASCYLSDDFGEHRIS